MPAAIGRTHKPQEGSRNTSRGSGATGITGAKLAAEMGGGGGKITETGRRSYGYAYGSLGLD